MTKETVVVVWLRLTRRKLQNLTNMNAALLIGAFCMTMLVVATANGAEIRAKRSAAEDAIMAESDVMNRQRRGDFNLECTAKCTGYWVCVAKNVFASATCDYPSGCECKCPFWQKC
uniref:Uncharacterized protein n=1 Tax=Plectus sambesii TaxID=2011161 RepID=A0A914VS98_9BILA